MAGRKRAAGAASGPPHRPPTDRRGGTGDPALDSRLQELVAELLPADARIALETISAVIRLAGGDVARLDRKILNSAIKEMSYAFRVFAPYRDIRKVSIFGSARVPRDDPEYEVARQFGRLIVERGWMVITGAGSGIMEAGHEGAGGERSFGANIRLPMEEKPNVIIAEDEKLINFKYFFTRKLTFMREADAFVLFPGGFGTMDETFELLTLMQTGKSDLHPIVLLERSGGTYWEGFDHYVKGELLERGYVSPEDVTLYRCVHSPEAAVEEIERFYHVYHSQRIVGGRLVFRLSTALDDAQLTAISREFQEVLRGPIERVEASKEEIRDDDVPDLPRIVLPVDWERAGILRRLIDRLNEA